MNVLLVVPSNVMPPPFAVTSVGIATKPISIFLSSTRNVVVSIVVVEPLTVKFPDTTRSLLTIVLPVDDPIVTLVPAPAILMVVAFVLKIVAVIEVVVMSPPFTAISPPAFILPPTPTPPVTISAPDVVFVDDVELEIVTAFVVDAPLSVTPSSVSISVVVTVIVFESVLVIVVIPVPRIVTSSVVESLPDNLIFAPPVAV